MTAPGRPFTGGVTVPQPGPNGQPPHPTVGYLGQSPGGAQPQGQGMVQPQQTVTPPNQQLMAAQMRQADPSQSLPQGLPPMPGQQQQQHPTMPLNPNPQQQYPGQQFQPQYQQPAPQQPQYQQQVQQPQPSAAQFQTPQGQRFEIPDHAILDGPQVPAELRGRTWGQVRQIYGALASQFLAGRQAPQQQEVQQPQQPQAPTQQFGRPQGPTRQDGGFWTDPEGTIARVVEQRVQQAMAPVVARTAQQAAEDAMRIAASGISDWAAIQPEVIQVIAQSGARPEQLGDPAVWNTAAELARGRLVARGQYNPGVVPAPQPQRGPGAYVPAQVAPPMGQFFTEAPTPPPMYPQQPNMTMTPDEEYYQRKSGLPPEEWMAWRNSITRVRG